MATGALTLAHGGSMKLTTAFRDRKVGTLKGTKHHYLACHVDFTTEERAIIQERGLYDLQVTVPSDTPLPTRSGDFLAMLMRLAGVILAPLGLLFACGASISPVHGAGAGPPGWLMLIGGVALFTIGKWKDRQAYRREASPDQIITLGRLLQNPDYLVQAYSLQEAKQLEEQVRETLAVLADSLRANKAQPAQTSYEL